MQVPRPVVIDLTKPPRRRSPILIDLTESPEPKLKRKPSYAPKLKRSTSPKRTPSYSPKLKRSASPKRTPSPEPELRRGGAWERIGQGKQAWIGRRGQRVRKQYKDYGVERLRVVEDFADNLAFLKNNQATGRVPELFDWDSEEGWIEMRYLSDYEPLKTYNRAKRAQLKANLAPLLRELYQARLDIGPAGVDYTDMANLGNIAVRLEPLSVKFYEGGRIAASNLAPPDLARAFLQEVLRELKLDRNRKAQSIYDAITAAGPRN